MLGKSATRLLAREIRSCAVTIQKSFSNLVFVFQDLFLVDIRQVGYVFLFPTGVRVKTQVSLSYLLLLYKHEFHETCHSVISYFIKKDSKRRSDTTTPESIHTKDGSKSSSTFAFIFCVN